MAGAATMVVVWGNILSLLGNVFAIAVDILVFDAFFPRNDNRKKALVIYFTILPDFYISLYPHWHKTRIYIQNVTRDRANICVMCFSISKPLGSTLLYCRNCLFCFIFLQSLVRVLLPICWKFGLRRIYMECSSILRAILRSRVYFPICCTDY